MDLADDIEVAPRAAAGRGWEFDPPLVHQTTAFARDRQLTQLPGVQTQSPRAWTSGSSMEPPVPMKNATQPLVSETQSAYSSWQFPPGLPCSWMQPKHWALAGMS